MNLGSNVKPRNSIGSDAGSKRNEFHSIEMTETPKKGGTPNSGSINTPIDKKTKYQDKDFKEKNSSTFLRSSESPQFVTQLNQNTTATTVSNSTVNNADNSSYERSFIEDNVSQASIVDISPTVFNKNGHQHHRHRFFHNPFKRRESIQSDYSFNSNYNSNNNNSTTSSNIKSNNTNGNSNSKGHGLSHHHSNRRYHHNYQFNHDQQDLHHIFGGTTPTILPYSLKSKLSKKRENSKLYLFIKKYPCRIIKFLIGPEYNYVSKILERRSYILILLSIVMFVVFIVATAIHPNIWYIFSPGILLTLISIFLAKFTKYYYLSSFLLLFTCTSVNITSNIVRVARNQLGTGLVFVWDIFIMISVPVLIPSIIPCLIVLTMVGLSYIGLAIYLQAGQKYNLIDNYESFNDEIRNIIITYVLLIISSIISSIDLREIERNEARIQSLFNISKEALIVHKDGIITDANPAFENMFQTKVQDLMYPQSGIWEFLPELEPLFKNKEFDLDVIETTANDASGRDFQVEVRSNKATYAGMNVDVLSIIDITGRKQLMEADVALRKAEAANEAKVVFLTTISHELRTPITGILSSAELLERCQIDPGYKDFLRYIKVSAILLNDLINDILDYSKIEAGKLSLHKVDFSLLKMIEDTIRIISVKIIEKNLELCVFIDENVPVIVNGDSNRVKQILLNFLSNAAKFTKVGEIIVRVKLFPKPPTVMDPNHIMLLFEVEDSGIGIKEEDLGLLFTAFSQIDSGNSRKYQGTGLGLSISKKLCSMMNGNVFVASNFGKGSVFSFTVEFEQVSHEQWSGFTLKSLVSCIYMNEKLPGLDIPSILSKKYNAGIIGVVIDPVSDVRDSVSQYFSLLNMACFKLSSESEFKDYMTTLDSKSPSNIFLVVTSFLNQNRNDVRVPHGYQFVWVYLSQHNDNPPDGFDEQITKPCLFSDIIQIIYNISDDNINLLIDPFFEEDVNNQFPLGVSNSGAKLSHSQRNIKTPSQLLKSEKDQSKNGNGNQLNLSSSSVSVNPTKSATSLISPSSINAPTPPTSPATPGSSIMKGTPNTTPILPIPLTSGELASTPTPSEIISSPPQENVSPQQVLHPSQQQQVLHPSQEPQQVLHPSQEPQQVLHPSQEPEQVLHPSQQEQVLHPPREEQQVLHGKDAEQEQVLHPSQQVLHPPRKEQVLHKPQEQQQQLHKPKTTPNTPPSRKSHRGYVKTPPFTSSSSTPASKTTTPTKSSPKLASPSPKGKILLVEDNQINVSIFSRFLRDSGYQFSVAYNGIEAIDKVKSETFELILMDCQMPEMDGLTATKVIREMEKEKKLTVSPNPNRKHSFIVIIALTAGSSYEDRQSCLDAGMNDFLEKPAKCSALIQMINKWIKKH